MTAYRLPLNGIYDRLMITASLMSASFDASRITFEAKPYENAEAFLAEITMLIHSLMMNKGEHLVYPRWAS